MGHAAGEDGCTRSGMGSERQVDCGPRTRRHRLPDGRGDANDGEPRRRSRIGLVLTQSYPLAEWIRVREVRVGEALIHDRGVMTWRAIQSGETAASLDLNAQALEISA